MPWEHYTQEFATADPKEIASRLSIPYDEEAKKLTLTFLGTQYQITWPDFEVTHTPDDKGFYPLENMRVPENLRHTGRCHGEKYI